MLRAVLATVVFTALLFSKIVLAADLPPSADFAGIVATGSTEQIEAALKNGADANAKDGAGVSVLYLTVVRNQTRAAELLLQAGATGLHDLYEVPGKPKLPKMRLLSLAAWNGFNDMATMLLRRGARVNDPDADGRTAMAGAIVSGNIQTAGLLLEAGTDPNLRWGTGYSALSQAAIHGRLDILKMLKERGGNINFREDHGITPLMFAIQMKRGEVALFLIEQGALVYPSDASNNTALSLAKKLENPEMRDALVSALLKAGAKEGETVRPLDGRFLKACHAGNLAAVTDLLKQGADMQAQGTFDGDLYLPNALSAAVGHKHIIEFLLKRGLSPHMLSNYDYSPLHTAAEHGTPEVIALLIGAGLDPNKKAKHGQTPLYMAINGGAKLENIVTLLKMGANPNVKALNNRESLLEFAKARKRPKLVELLVEAGAK